MGEGEGEGEVFFARDFESFAGDRNFVGRKKTRGHRIGQYCIVMSVKT